MKKIKIIFTMAIVCALSLVGCAGMEKPMLKTKAVKAYKTAVHDDLINIPAPRQPIYVAVYKFKDQTGQYKTNENTASFSTAVTQGATSIAIQALAQSGWFIPIEREGLSNILTERKIISAHTQNKAKTGKGTENLPALVSAPIVIEGGIIAYETNMVTDGVGLKHFGIDGSGIYRRDMVTVYMRAVSVITGQVIKSVSTQKVVLSRQVSLGAFRFVRFKDLLEVESGVSYNEPPQMCVLEAVEKAVYDLIMEGIADGNWQIADKRGRKHPAVLKYIKSKNTGKEVVFDEKGNIVKIKR